MKSGKKEGPKWAGKEGERKREERESGGDSCLSLLL